MGSCVSSNGTSVPSTSAKLILMDGSMKEFSIEVRSQEILQEYPDHFICNSDGLYVGQNISQNQILGDDDQLQTGELYFLFPRRMLQIVLTVPDMASLLFKINNAWVSAQKKKKGQSRRLSCGIGKAQAQVQPFFDIDTHHADACGEEYHSSSVCCMSRRPNVPTSITKSRGQIQLQTKLEMIAEIV